VYTGVVHDLKFILRHEKSRDSDVTQKFWENPLGHYKTVAEHKKLGMAMLCYVLILVRSLAHI